VLASKHRLVEAVPNNHVYQADLIHSLQLLGDLHRSRGNLDTAWDALRQAEVILLRLADTRGAMEANVNELATAYGALGWAYNEKSRTGRAVACGRQAVALQEKLATAHPEKRSSAAELGGA
jgi:hypothetical protein